MYTQVHTYTLWGEISSICSWPRIGFVAESFQGLLLSSSHSSDGNSSLLSEGGSASLVPQASVELAGYESVVWPDSLSEWLVDGV